MRLFITYFLITLVAACGDESDALQLDAPTSASREAIVLTIIA
jgi:hypothetical protein